MIYLTVSIGGGTIFSTTCPTEVDGQPSIFRVEGEQVEEMEYETFNQDSGYGPLIITNEKWVDVQVNKE